MSTRSLRGSTRAALKTAGVAGATALVLASCSTSSDAESPSDTADGSSENSLEVFSYWTSGSEAAALDALIDVYADAAPDTEVTNAAVSGGGGANATATLQSRITGGNPPAIWQAAPLEGLEQYQTAGLLAPLTDLYAQDGLADAIPADVIDAVSVDGVPYGVLTGVHRSNALWYNSAVLEAADIDPAAISSLDDLLALGDTLDAQGVSPLCVGSQGGYGGRVLFENVLFAELGVDNWEALFDGETSWDAPEVEAAVQGFVDSMELWNDDASVLTWNDAAQRLGSGECAFLSMGDWAYGELINQGFEPDADFGYVEFPGSQGTFLANGDLFVQSADAAENGAATQWLQAVASADGQLAFNAAKGSVPVRSDVDVSSLSAYQQETAELFQEEDRSYSFQQGAMAPAGYVQAFSDALVELESTQDVDSFISAMVQAAQS